MKSRLKHLDEAEKKMQERESLLNDKEVFLVDVERKKMSAKTTNEVKKVLIDVAGEGECQICCMTKDVNFAIVPCGHSDLCEDCLKELKRNKHKCPSCRGEIKDYIKLYLNRQVELEREVMMIQYEAPHERNSINQRQSNYSWFGGIFKK